jgi:hypothetical protein
LALRGFDAAQGVCADSSGAAKSKVTLPDRAYDPQGCAIDPSTGDLAVTNVTDFQGYYFCGYDGKGDRTARRRATRRLD